MRSFKLFLPLILLFLSCSSNSEKSTEKIRAEILLHGAEIRQAFAENDLEKIKLLHHPDVEKALGYNDLKKGREEVIASLKGTLDNFTLDFIKNDVESVEITGASLRNRSMRRFLILRRIFCETPNTNNENKD